MATEKRKPNPQFITPRGVFVYPSLNKPDFGTKDYPKPDGEYKVTLRLTQAQADAWREGPLKAVIARAREEADAAFAALPIATRKKLKELTFNECGTDEYDKVSEEPTGFVLFKIGMKASGLRDKGTPKEAVWNQKPQVFDSKGIALDKVPDIWGGSEGYVSVEAGPYFIPGTGAAGVSLRLKGVQLMKLVQGGQRDAAAHGFAAQEDGFDANEYTAPPPKVSAGADQAGDPGAGPDDF